MDSIEPLEPRIAPAALTMGGKLLTYTDYDGDLVKISFTNATMAEGNCDFGAGGFLPGDTTTKQQLGTVDLKGKTGAGFTLMAKPQMISGRLAGDSHADIFEIDGTNTDLGTIKVDGDVVSFPAGDMDFTNGPGIKSLTVLSIGRDSTAGVTFRVNRLGALTVKSDFGPHAALIIDGGAKSIFIGGSMLGTRDQEYGGIWVASGDVGTFKVGGSLFGNFANPFGNINVAGDVGTLSIHGSVIGDDYTSVGANTPQIEISGGVKNLTIGGDVVGHSSEYGGAIEIRGDAGPIKIGGSLIGSDQSHTGYLRVRGNATTISIGHDVTGGNSTSSSGVQLTGAVVVNGSLGNLLIGGDFTAGRVYASGLLAESGMVGISGTLGPVKIGGNIVGDPTHLAYITAGGSGATAPTPAIKSLTVKGSVISASILAGYDYSFVERNLLAGIGSVSIGGNLAGSFIIAGSNKGGDGIPGNSDDGKANNTTLISSVKIDGAFTGLAGDATRFYVFAPQIGKLRVGAASYTGAQLTSPGVYFSSVGTAIVEAAG